MRRELYVDERVVFRTGDYSGMRFDGCTMVLDLHGQCIDLSNTIMTGCTFEGDGWPPEFIAMICSRHDPIAPLPAVETPALPKRAGPTPDKPPRRKWWRW